MSSEVDAVMSTFHVVLYSTLGLLFVLSGLLHAHQHIREMASAL